MKKFLGIQVVQTSRRILLYQTTYAKSIVEKYSQPHLFSTPIPLAPSFKLQKDTRTAYTNECEYQALIGQLLYFTKTRPDIA
jgi:hypothetical protein